MFLLLKASNIHFLFLFFGLFSTAIVSTGLRVDICCNIPHSYLNKRALWDTLNGSRSPWLFNMPHHQLKNMSVHLWDFSNWNLQYGCGGVNFTRKDIKQLFYTDSCKFVLFVQLILAAIDSNFLSRYLCIFWKEQIWKIRVEMTTKFVNQVENCSAEFLLKIKTTISNLVLCLFDTFTFLSRATHLIFY